MAIPYCFSLLLCSPPKVLFTSYFGRVKSFQYLFSFHPIASAIAHFWLFNISVKGLHYFGTSFFFL